MNQSKGGRFLCVKLSLLITIALYCKDLTVCTTFAIQGRNTKNGNIFIAKNRDAMAPYQHLAVRKEKGSIPYLGLFYSEQNKRPYPYITAGINIILSN